MMRSDVTDSRPRRLTAASGSTAPAVGAPRSANTADEAGEGRVARRPGDAPAERRPGSDDAADPAGISRRTALKVIASATALGAAPAACDPGDPAAPASGQAPSRSADSADRSRGNPLAAGSPSDPDLLAPVVPWERVLTDQELRLVAALADVIIPADERSPSASAVGVPAYIDEYVSAPRHEAELTLLRGGLAWLNRAARERFGAVDFPALTETRKHEICDPICYEPQAPAHLKAQARFFDLFRDMTATGFWTTEAGMRDLGYVGNVPLPSFEGPPPEVLERLGLSEEDLATTSSAATTPSPSA